MDINNVLVVGAGLMGSGIAQVCAQAGILVRLNDVSREALDAACRNIDWSVAKLIEKGKLSEDHGAIMAMYQETGEARFFPPLLLRRKVKAGHLGRKTGRGWYTYDENGNRE